MITLLLVFLIGSIVFALILTGPLSIGYALLPESDKAKVAGALNRLRFWRRGQTGQAGQTQEPSWVSRVWGGLTAPFRWVWDYVGKADPSRRPVVWATTIGLLVGTVGALYLGRYLWKIGWFDRGQGWVWFSLALCSLLGLILLGLVRDRRWEVRVVGPLLTFAVIGWMHQGEVPLVPNPKTQSVAAAAQGIPNRIFHHKLNPTQKDEPFLWNNVQLQLEPGHSYVAWCEGSIDLDPKDEVRQSLEQTYGAVFSDPHILQISPDSAKMSPAWVKKTWFSNWPMPNEPVGIPIAKVGDGLYMRLYSRPTKFTVPAKIWDSRFTISMNLPRSDYLRGDIDNHSVFVQGTHGFYTLFLREVAD